MSLTTRQTQLYQDDAIILEPVKPAGTTSEGLRKELTYSVLGPSVSCKFFRRGETSYLLGVGRFPKDSDYQLDRFHFDVSQEINDGYYVVIATIGHPYYGFVWAVDGVPVRRQSSAVRRPNYVMAYVKHVIAPFNFMFGQVDVTLGAITSG